MHFSRAAHPGNERSTYYTHVNRRQQEPNTVHRRGRPAPGYSCTQDGKPVSDEQICEWIMELLADEYTSAYGYRKLTKVLRRQPRDQQEKSISLMQANELLRPLAPDKM